MGVNIFVFLAPIDVNMLLILRGVCGVPLGPLKPYQLSPITQSDHFSIQVYFLIVVQLLS